jgi:uncharacterized protein YyaL (SSP411 family)
LTPTVQWLPWHTDAFARARAEDKPVLLSIAASWSESCYEMDSTTYADAAIVARVHERFVPVRVDVDRRPDISERYGLGGWPTTAFLTADGDVIGGGTFVPIERMPSVLDRVTEAFKSGRVERAAAHACARPPVAATTGSSAHVAGAVSGSEAEALAQQVFVGFDPDHGGFGGDAKFPLTAPLDLALSVYRATNDPGMAQVIETTLDAMGWGGLYDDVDGGFFRYAGARDWGQPHREKLLEVNATLLSIYLDAWHTLNVPRYRDRAVDVLRYVQTWLADPVDAGWAGSQAASGARDSTSERIDRTLYAGANASMASSALRASELLDETALGEFALRSLERVSLGCYKPGMGVAHYVDDRVSVRGLLDDQVWMAAAHLDAHAATGNIVYEMMAQELMHYAVRTMWDEADGGFFDRTVPDEHERIGRMRDRLKPFASNCDAARLLRRLASTRGDHDFAARADATLTAMAPLAGAQGPLAAHYLLALRQLPQ